MAEVLITLAIIGVVAALTIPTLITSYQEKVTVTKVKKFYSTLSNAVSMVIAENGQVNQWDVDYSDFVPGNEMFYEYIKPYLKISVDCVKDNKKECNYSGLITWLSGAGGSWYYDDNDKYYKFILSDGSLAWYRINKFCGTDGDTSDVCALFWYDINGTSQPNTLGRDIFVFYVRPYGVIPHKGEDCYLGPADGRTTGWGCAAYIIKNGNMNYPVNKE